MLKHLWSVIKSNQAIKTIVESWSRDHSDFWTAKINRPKMHSCLNFEPLKIKWSKKNWFRSQMLQQATYKCMTTPRNTRWTFYLTLKYKMMKFSFKTDVVWSHILNGLGMDFLSTHRKAAGVLSKHPTRIQNGAEAKKLVIWSFLTFVWEMD